MCLRRYFQDLSFVYLPGLDFNKRFSAICNCHRFWTKTLIDNNNNYYYFFLIIFLHSWLSLSADNRMLCKMERVDWSQSDSLPRLLSFLFVQFPFRFSLPQVTNYRKCQLRETLLISLFVQTGSRGNYICYMKNWKTDL